MKTTVVLPDLSTLVSRTLLRRAEDEAQRREREALVSAERERAKQRLLDNAIQKIVDALAAADTLPVSVDMPDEATCRVVQTVLAAEGWKISVHGHIRERNGPRRCPHVTIEMPRQS